MKHCPRCGLSKSELTEAWGGKRVESLILDEQIRSDLEGSIRYREHQEDEPGHKSWWACLPVADVDLYIRLHRDEVAIIDDEDAD